MARAEVRSVDALHQFRLALVEYEDNILESVTLLELEMRKALDWIEHDRSSYWPEQVRRSSDKLTERRNDLERCEMAIRAEDRKSCMVERKALDRAKQRLRLCEQKVNVVKKWRVELSQQGAQMSGRLARLRDVIERDVPNAIATLGRLITALEQYAAVSDSALASEPKSAKSPTSDSSANSTEDDQGDRTSDGKSEA